MNKLIFTAASFSAVLMLNSCGGESAETPATDSTQTTTPVVVKPEPVTTASGSTANVIDGTVGYNDKEVKYTLLEYTTNTVAADLPIEEFHEPADDEQILSLRIEAEVIKLTNLLYYSPNNSFNLFLTEGGEEIDSFTRFSEEFAAGLDYKDLKPGEKQDIMAYFKVPADADLTNAFLSIYMGSDTEPVTLKLNNN